MKFDYKSYSKHLESENERLNAIIDELEDLNEDYLTENFLLNVKINKAIEYIKKYTDNTNFIEVPSKELLEILGDNINES